MRVEVGDRAPAFTLPTDGGGKISLKDLKGRTVALYFYPKDDTSGCTAEACAFIDGKGVIRNVWRKVKVPGHAAEVLKAAAALD